MIGSITPKLGRGEIVSVSGSAINDIHQEIKISGCEAGDYSSTTGITLHLFHQICDVCQKIGLLRWGNVPFIPLIAYYC